MIRYYSTSSECGTCIPVFFFKYQSRPHVNSCIATAELETSKYDSDGTVYAPNALLYEPGVNYIAIVF